MSGILYTPESAMALAIENAESFRGATSPNPPVGAVALDPTGKLLAVASHQRAGGFHAERELLETCARLGVLHRLHTLVVTLEPCVHVGRTPPCTEAIRESSVRRVIIGCLDPNPMVRGRGVERLLSLGLEVRVGVLEPEALALIAPFTQWIYGKRPWITVKQALQANHSMIPPAGQKTFTSRDSISLSHRLRKRADAILTGSGTILADLPLFTVRSVEDHPGKKRCLIILDRRRRVPDSYLEQARHRGFEVWRGDTFEEACTFMREHNVLEVLVEAGPTLLESIQKSGLWDEWVTVQAQANPLAPDLIQWIRHDQLRDPDKSDFEIQGLTRSATGSHQEQASDRQPSEAL